MQCVDGDLGDLLGLRPGHEYAGSDGEFQGAERGEAGDVLQRLALGTACHEGLERGGIRLAQRRIGGDAGLQLAPGAARHMPDQQFRADLRVEDAGRSEPGRRGITNLAQGAGGGIC